MVVTHYGESDEIQDHFCTVAHYANRDKGAEFQNLKKLMSVQPGLFADYDYIRMMDDDILTCLPLARWQEFWVCSPSFRPDGKISWPLTEQESAGTNLRLVNFVEMTWPIFRADKMRSFMDVFDDSPTGYGTDLWYAAVMHLSEFGRAAIFDRVSVSNPHDRQKAGGEREINKLLDLDDCIAQWHSLQKRAHIPAIHTRVLGQLKVPPEVAFGRRRDPSPKDVTPLVHGRNLAYRQRAWQSFISRWSKGRTREADAAGAVNGDRHNDYPFHTDNEDNPWWMVDLGADHMIAEIQIYNRAGPIELVSRASPMLIETSRDQVLWHEFDRIQAGTIFATWEEPPMPLV